MSANFRHDSSGAALLGRALLLLLTVAGALMIAYRYANLSYLPFINDEPAFLDAARDQVRTGHWVSFSPLVGKQGLHYGPTVLWLYGVVHLVLGSRAATHVFVMLSLMTASHLAFAYGLYKRFGRMAGTASFVLLASSPYQFFWSRLAWDQVVDIGSAMTLFVLCTYERLSVRTGLLLGTVVGLAVSSHLMVLPLAILVFLFLGIESTLRGRWIPTLVAGTSALVVNLPYLGYLVHHYKEASPTEPLSWDLVQKYALEPARVATLNGVDYFFDDAWSSFAAERHWAGSAWTSPDVKTALAAVAAMGLCSSAWTGRGARRRVSLLGLAAWVGYAFFFGQRRVGDPPHYQFATWWIIPLGVAAAVWSLERRWRWIGLGAAAVVGIVSLAQMRFIVDWMAYVRLHGGTRNVHYGAVLSEQVTAMRAVCANPAERVLVYNDTHLFDLSLRYVASTEPACSAKSLSFCGSEDCGAAQKGARARVGYAKPGSAWLFVKTE